MATAAQIRNRAATKLGLLGVGQTLPSYITSDLDTAYAEVYAQLDAKSLVDWDDDESIPDEYSPHLVALVARARITDYMPPPNRLGVIIAEAAVALPELRELQSNNVYSVPVSNYY
jgi:hypothetical protein